MSGRPVWTSRWLRENGYDVYGPQPERTGPVAVPDATKPVSELRRGDEIRNAVGQWVSVADVSPGMDGRIRVVLAGWKLLGWFDPDQQMTVSPSTAKAYEPRRRVLRGRDLVHQVLVEYFPDVADHGGARDVANNLVSGLDGVKRHELEAAIAGSLEEKGLPRPVAEAAARRCRVAWLMGLAGH